MDMRAYASKFIRPDSVRDGPIQTRIIRVFENERYSRPTLELENGSEFTLNGGNLDILINAFGPESDNWVGQQIELSLGTYKNWKTTPPTDAETVKVRPTPMVGNSGAPGKPALPASRTAASFQDDLDDSVPF